MKGPQAPNATTTTASNAEVPLSLARLPAWSILTLGVYRRIPLGPDRVWLPLHRHAVPLIMTNVVTVAVARPWLIAGVVVGIAWIIGVEALGRWADPDEFAEIPFELEWSVLLPMQYSLPVALAAGLLRGFALPPLIRAVALAFATIALSFWAFVSSFGGICLNTGEQCLVSPESHLVGILVPVGRLALGFAVETVIRVVRASSRTSDVAG